MCFLSASELKNNGCAHSISSTTTHFITEARNKGNCSKYLAEGAYLVLALASLVEAVARFVLALMVSLVSLALTPFICCVHGLGEGLQNITHGIPAHFATIAWTGVRSGANVVPSVIALVQNFRIEGPIDYDKDLLPCSSEPEPIPETKK